MTEPFLLAMPGAPDVEGAWHETAPVEFRDPAKSICLVPMTSRISAADRGLMTDEEIRADPAFLKSARANTSRNAVRRGTEGEYLSVRSNKTGMPATAMFFMAGREKLFDALGIDPGEHYFIFITQDETLLARKSDLHLSNIRRTTRNIKNKLASLYPEGCPVLATEVFVYDKDARKYKEA